MQHYQNKRKVFVLAPRQWRHVLVFGRVFGAYRYITLQQCADTATGRRSRMIAADTTLWMYYICPHNHIFPRPNPIPDRGADVRDGGFQGQVSGGLISGHSPPWLACSFSVQATNYQHATERCTLLYAMWMSQLITNYTLSQNVPPSVCYCFDLQQHMLTIWGRNVNDKVDSPN